jgi:hypothetical protein
MDWGREGRLDWGPAFPEGTPGTGCDLGDEAGQQRSQLIHNRLLWRLDRFTDIYHLHKYIIIISQRCR